MNYKKHQYKRRYKLTKVMLRNSLEQSHSIFLRRIYEEIFSEISFEDENTRVSSLIDSQQKLRTMAFLNFNANKSNLIKIIKQHLRKQILFNDIISGLNGKLIRRSNKAFQVKNKPLFYATSCKLYCLINNKQKYIADCIEVFDEEVFQKKFGVLEQNFIKESREVKIKPNECI